MQETQLGSSALCWLGGDHFGWGRRCFADGWGTMGSVAADALGQTRLNRFSVGHRSGREYLREIIFTLYTILPPSIDILKHSGLSKRVVRAIGGLGMASLD